MTTAVDYSSVANRYDRNAIRTALPRDEHLATLPPGAHVLDLACGTAAYIAAQLAHDHPTALFWHGADASPAMLAVARSKLPETVDLRNARAEALPFATHTFDYIVCRFAFHHFEDKNAALAEMRRVLRPGGRLRIENLAPELSPDWWMYRFFPATRSIDTHRFWSVADLTRALTTHGFTPNVMTEQTGDVTAASILFEARNRETSHLVLIDDDAYQLGLAKLEAELGATPDALVPSGLVLADITA